MSNTDKVEAQWLLDGAHLPQPKVVELLADGRISVPLDQWALFEIKLMIDDSLEFSERSRYKPSKHERWLREKMSPKNLEEDLAEQDKQITFLRVLSAHFTSFVWLADRRKAEGSESVPDGFYETDPARQYAGAYGLVAMRPPEGSQ